MLFYFFAREITDIFCEGRGKYLAVLTYLLAAIKLPRNRRGSHISMVLN